MVRHLPNLLSALRLLAAPAAAWAILADHDTLALAIFAFAGLSDLADGFIARRWGFASRFGAWLDPIADKLLMLLCFIALFSVGAVAIWLVVLVIARDALIATGALLAKALNLPMRVAPLMIGKASTAVQIGYVGVLLLLLAFDRESPRLVAAGAYTVAVFTILSLLAYGQLFLRVLLFGRRTA
ncbi:MAG TPA: CDP-alcohol phosphatidyltransferase family protein [Rhizomicrobium sp.]|nr:CDP-alcohol phosphatidyltransferase family protein [Rhizomicrobium sp.]